MPQSLINRIFRDTEICHGKPTIRGLSFQVDAMLELMGSGITKEDFLKDNPDLQKGDFLAWIEYAAKLIQIKSIYRIAS